MTNLSIIYMIHHFEIERYYMVTDLMDIDLVCEIEVISGIYDSKM